MSRCQYCGGTLIYKLGNSIEPARTVCMACGREPKGEEKKMEEKKKCSKCGEMKDFDQFNKNRAVKDGLDNHCSDCKRKYQRKLRERKKKNVQASNGRRKKSIQEDDLKIDDAILLDQQILKAIKKSVANQIIQIIKESFI